jgi:MSHA biogenesis protein MshL
VRVSRRALDTRIFAINCIGTRRSGTRILAANTAVDAAGRAVSSGDKTAAGGRGTQVSATDDSDLFEEIATGLATLMSADGKFNLDRKASLLQVTDYPDRLDRIGLYLETVETRVNRQVHIQANVIEVELREPFSTGINWSTLFHASAGITVTEESGAKGGGAVTLGVKLRDFDALVRALESQGRVRVLASPSVVAMNNEPAVMRVGTEDVFFLCTSEIDEATGRVTQTTALPQTITEGVVLSVTPQISSDGVISMSIAPTITDRTGQATSRYGDTVPIVSVREANTVVRVREGETVIIAGLMQERPVSYEGKVPVLGDVPLLGGLFRRDEQATHKTDLVILLTPTMRSPPGRPQGPPETP